MKLTQSEAQELLRRAGVKDAQIVADDAADADFSADAALQAIDDTRVAFHKPAIEKDALDTANRAAAGKYGGVLRRNLAKATGLSASELEKIEKDDEAIAYAIAKHREKLSGNEKEMQEAIEAERTAWAEKEKQISQEWEAKVKAERDRYYDREIDTHILKELKDAPIPANADRSAVASLLKSEMRKNFDLQYDENGQTVKVINRADNLPAKNKAGNDNFSLKEYAEGVLSPYALWSTDMRGTDPAKALEQRGNSGGQQQNQLDTSGDPVQAARQRALAVPALQG